MGEPYSYGRQTVHYFDRPHEAVPTTPVGGAAAWRGVELAAGGDWHVRLDDAEIDELLEATACATASGRPIAELTLADFPLQGMQRRIDAWRRELGSGRGFVLVSGVPVERLSRDEVERLFWCLGLHMGHPGAQNSFGDTLGHVVDTGEDGSDPFVRLYRTSSDIAYHCDAADVVALLCLNPAKQGGASRIVSSVAVFDELMRRRSDLCERLFDPFRLDIRDANDHDLHFIEVPPCRFSEGTLRTFYHSDYFRSVVRHEEVPPFSDEELELMDLYETIANDPAFHLDMQLSRGDIQWVSNHVILHARTGYEDFEEPDRKRHLLRLWLSLEARS